MVEAVAAASPMAFKRRKRPLGVPTVAVRSPSVTNGSDEDEKQASLSETLEELIALRKLKRMTGGIELDRLNAGEQKRKTAKPKNDGTQVVNANGMVEGLIGGITNKGTDRMRNEPEPDPDDADAKTRRLVKSNNFTGQTNAVDVDKHMMAYIEQELRKRKNGGMINTEEELRSLDPRDELYQIAEKYRTEKKEVEEGNVTLSAAMLTAIPEVDLGIDIKLKNIEETEKAKRALYEGRRKSSQDDGQFAADRFYRARRPLESDADALAKARREVQGGGGDAAPAKSKNTGSGRRELATDDLVMNRFKKRQRK